MRIKEYNAAIARAEKDLEKKELQEFRNEIKEKLLKLETLIKDSLNNNKGSNS